MSTTVIQTSKTTDTVTLTLDSEQINYIVEALLFSASVNIGAVWEETDFNKMIEIAKNLKSTCNNINLQKICFYKEDNYEDNWSKDIFNIFKKNLKVLNLEKA